MAVDTLKIYERLKSHEMPDGAARELAEILKENIEIAQAELATKKQLEVAELALRKDIEVVALALRKDIEVVALALRKDIDAAELALRKDIDALRLSTKQDVSIAVETLRKEMAEMKYDIIKWLVALLVIQTIAAKLFLK